MTFNDKIQKARDIIKNFAFKNVCIATSWGKDSMVLLSLVLGYELIPVISVLSDTEFKETLTYRDVMILKYNIGEYYTEYLYSNQGVSLENCCRKNKVEKFKEALKDYDYWFSGIRRSEVDTRKKDGYIEKIGNIVKVNPILDFTEKDVWRYLAFNNIPVNPAYRMGYRSLSCKRCSHKEENENEPERKGRWRGTKCEGGECGIHTQILK